ncbi:hypothetical protein ACFL42_00765 [Candidatus Omnitrophota bacterium]
MRKEAVLLFLVLPAIISAAVVSAETAVYQGYAGFREGIGGDDIENSAAVFDLAGEADVCVKMDGLADLIGHAARIKPCPIEIRGAGDPGIVEKSL